MSKRTQSHITETKSLKKFLNIIPDHWVVRELSERDYGIDLVVEIFNQNGLDKNGNAVYESSGSILNIQLKGVANGISSPPKYRLKQSYLLYVEKFAIPSILVLVDVKDNKSRTYFVWLQKYIRLVLDLESPDWRTEKTDGGNSPTYSINMPESNTLESGLKKLVQIANRVKLMEESIEFYEAFSVIERLIDDAGSGHCELNTETCEFIIGQCRRLQRLRLIFESNEFGVEEQSILNIIRDITYIKAKSMSISESNLSEQLEPFRLLASNCVSRLAIEEFNFQESAEPPY